MSSPESVRSELEEAMASIFVALRELFMLPEPSSSGVESLERFIQHVHIYVYSQGSYV